MFVLTGRCRLLSYEAHTPSRVLTRTVLKIESQAMSGDAQDEDRGGQFADRVVSPGGYVLQRPLNWV